MVIVSSSLIMLLIASVWLGGFSITISSVGFVSATSFSSSSSSVSAPSARSVLRVALGGLIFPRTRLGILFFDCFLPLASTSSVCTFPAPLYP
uniref:Putative secreted protein n=1 Tax=Anopheles darlingi TaxID=43151 RepID=A0A2M4D4F6_ANODA